MTFTETPGNEPREFCYRCHKPRKTCVCSTVTPVANHTHVLILQHPRERFHALGTVRLLRLGLERVACRVHFDLAKGPSDAQELVQPEAALLYPGPEAKDLTEMSAAERPRQLVVLDGTWSHAHALFKANPWVQRLPRVRINRDLPSQYRIRKEPRKECLSTVEAVVEALTWIEPDTAGFHGLIEAFTTLIDRQIEETPPARRVPRKRRTRPLAPSRSIPVALWKAPEVVVVYCEASTRRGAGGTERELLYVTGLRLGDGAVFTAVVEPRTIKLEPRHLKHMGLSPDALEKAQSVEDVAAAWADFAGGSVRAAWNQSTLDYLKAVDPVPKAVCLKSAYCNLRRGGRGHLVATLSAEGLEDEAMPALVEGQVQGRSAARLARSATMAQWLIGKAQESA